MRGFSIPSVSGRLESNVGYIKINGFYKNTASEFKAAAEKLIENGVTVMAMDCAVDIDSMDIRLRVPVKL